MFETWCSGANLESLPALPHTVVLFITSQVEQQRNPSTITRRLAAISLAHKAALFPSPTRSMEVIDMMKRVRRGWSKRPARKKAALEADIQAMLGTVNSQSARGLRNRALLLLGFVSGFSRSDLVALDIEDLRFTERGLEVHITRSTAGQDPQLREIWIPPVPGSTNCPVRALTEWLTVVGNKNGPIFRRMRNYDKVGGTRLSAQSVALIVKEHAKRAGLDPDLFSGHSLRRGFLTSAAKRGISLQRLAQQSGHRSWEILRQYFEKTDGLEDHPGAELLK